MNIFGYTLPVLPSLLQVVVAFFALVATDIFWAQYVRKVADKLPLASSIWAVALFGSGAVAVIGYTANPWLVLPSAIGAFVGTYVAVWYEKKIAEFDNWPAWKDWFKF